MKIERIIEESFVNRCVNSLTPNCPKNSNLKLTPDCTQMEILTKQIVPPEIAHHAYGCMNQGATQV